MADAPTSAPVLSDSTPGLSTPLSYATPEQIRSLYLHALALRQHPGGITHPIGWLGGLGYGLEHAGSNFGAAMLENRAAEMSRQQREAMAEAADPTGGSPGGAQPTTGPRSDAGSGTGDGAGDQNLSGDTMAALEGHIARNESGGINPKTGGFNYSATGPTITNPHSPYYGDKAYGYSQVMGKNIPEWTQQILGQRMTPEQYLASPEAQQRVTRNKLAQYLQQSGGSPRDAASMWFTGRPYSGQTALLNDYQPGGRGGMTNQQYSGGLPGGPSAPPTRVASNEPTTALGYSDQPQQAIATALAAPSSGTVAPPASALDPRTQYAQAANPQQQQPQQSSAMVYQQMISRLIRAGATPEEATSMAQHQMGLLPKYEMQNGMMYKTQPGAPPQFVGPVPGYRDIQPAPGGLPGYTERYYDNSGQMHMRVVPMDTDTGARGVAPAPAARPGAPAPSGGQTTAIPPMPTGPGTTLQDLQNWQAQKEAATKGLAKQAEEAGGGLAKMQVEQVSEDAKKGDLASKSIQYLRTMRELSHVPDAASINSGPHAADFLKVKEFVKDLTGYDAGGIATGEGIEKMNGYLAAAAAKELTNRPTQFDFKTFLERNPGLTVSQEGRDLLMDALESSFKQDQAISNAARKVKTADLENWPEIRQKVIDANPIEFTYRGQKLSTADKIPELQIAAPPPAAAAPAPAGGLPPGKYTWDPKTRKPVPVQ